MTVRPFRLAGCPRVPSEQARSLRGLLRSLAAVPAEFELDLPSMGGSRILFREIAMDGVGSDGPELALGAGGSAGRMTVAASLACALVDSALAGRPSGQGVRRLGPAERGILAALLAPVAARLGWTIRLDRFAPPVPGAPVLVFWLETKVGTGDIRVEMSPRSEGAVMPTERWDRGTWARAGRLPIVTAVEIAVTDLATREIMTLSPGDAVVFEGRSAATFGPAASWPGRIAVRSAAGRHGVSIEIDPRGALTVLGVISPIYEEGRMDASDSSSGLDAATVLAGAPVEVVAELGRVTLRGDELLGLAPGAVLRLAAGRKTIALRAAGELWAEGEIVDVDGELGVRVTRVFNR